MAMVVQAVMARAARVGSAGAAAGSSAAGVSVVAAELVTATGAFVAGDSAFEVSADGWADGAAVAPRVVGDAVELGHADIEAAELRGGGEADEHGAAGVAH